MQGIQDGGGFRMEKNKILALIVKMLIKGIISVAQTLASFHTQKSIEINLRSLLCVCVCVCVCD